MEQVFFSFRSEWLSYYEECFILWGNWLWKLEINQLVSKLVEDVDQEYDGSLKKIY